MGHLYVKPIGTVETAMVKRVLESLSVVTSTPFKLVANGEYPLFAFEPKRNQYYAKRIIERLAGELPADCEKLIGLTDVDLCTPVLTFVYGEAQLGGSVALVSFNRLRQEFYCLQRSDVLLIERITKECMHELGHCYGLFHCSDSRCVMFFSSSILSIDNKKKNFCIGCKEFFDTARRKENYASK